MGQYYFPIFLDKAKKPTILGFLESWSYKNGAKLMEHSYVGNKFVGAVQNLLERGVGKFAGSCLVWAGDYAKDEPRTKTNLFSMCDDSINAKKELKGIKPKSFQYAINETKHLYIDLFAIKGEWAIHPIPLLCCEGNGQGGGDYYGVEGNPDDEAVGTWARDVITFSNEIPTEEGFKEVKFNFKEDR